jgi:hypothetical protein
MKARAPLRFALALCSCLALTIPSVADSLKTYDTLVAKAEADGLSVDYTALRAAYAASDRNDPLGFSMDQNIGQMMNAVTGGDCDKALESSEKVLKASFINILAHLVRSECLSKKGELARAAREDTIVGGLRDSIFLSGDGDTKKTAYVVVTLDEERFVLLAKGLHEAKQALIQDEGHSYDLIDGKSKDGTTRSVYFQIDAITTAEARMFSGRR